MPATLIGHLFAPESSPTLACSTTVYRAIRLMREHGYSELPIVDAGRLDAVVSEHDLAAALLDPRDPGAITVGELVPEDFFVGRPDQPLVEALRLLVRHRLQRLAVIGDGDEFLGMLSDVEIGAALEEGRLQDLAASTLATAGRRPLRLLAGGGRR